MKNVFAYTEPGSNYPSYISLNRVDLIGPPEYRLTVRTSGSYNGSDIHLTTEQLGALANSILAEINQSDRCTYCDGTGYVHGPDGEWRGICTCNEE